MLLKFISMIARQNGGPQRLLRTPETQREELEFDDQYDRAVMTSKLVITYACALEVVHRALGETERNAALDLACGPGHFSLCVSKFLRFRNVVGLDRNPARVAAGQRNAAPLGFGDRVGFCEGDVLKLDGFETGAFDLTCFTNSAHHLDDLGSVGQVLAGMDRVTNDRGLVMVVDLVRLRTKALTERYVQTLGHYLIERGFPRFYEEFHDSMYAAWTAAELRSTIPSDSRRHWCHIVPRGLPTIQIILGLPVGRTKTFVRPELPWSNHECPVPEEFRWEWGLLRRSLFLFGARKMIWAKQMISASA